MNDLAARAQRAGILPGYHAIDGQWVETGPDTMAALLAAMAPREAPLPSWHVVVPGAEVPWEGPWRITYEDGSIAEGEGTLPGLPMGRHRVETRGTNAWLLAAPPRLDWPARGWGVTLPLYGLRPATGALAGYRDLAETAAGLARLGAGFVGINPVHAGFPADPGMYSPYSPSHRRRLSVDLIDAGEAEIPGLPGLVDYPDARARRMAALEARFAAPGPDAGFPTWRAEEGEALERFARHQALAERFGAYWSGWPAAYQSPDTPQVAAFAAEAADRVSFHAWLQYLATRQLAEAGEAAAGMAQGLYLDVAVGTHPHGAETWAAPSDFARGVSLGAPPDAFSPDGQAWGLAPFDPQELVATGFAAFAETLRSAMRSAGMIRIDHILGLERTFWVPDDGTPGGYVTMPRDALLAVVRIEATRAGCVVVGEDLGNVPEGLRKALEDSGVLGCAVAMFEQHWQADTPRFRHPGDWRPGVLASFGTHDLPPFEGWRLGSDIVARAALGLTATEITNAAMATRRAEAAAFDAMAGGAGLPQLLGESAACLVALQLEDILGLAEQANLPGTVAGHPNWQRRLPLGALDLEECGPLVEAAQVMRETGRQEITR